MEQNMETKRKIGRKKIFLKPPSPSNYKFKYDLGIDENVLDIFLPPGSLNDTGLYYIGLVDSTFNTGRQRPLEVTHRNYSLKLWWGQCLYWNSHKELWLPDGCFITPSSSLEVTECSCNQSTMFGASLQLTPNKLSFTDIEGFFSPNENPVALTLLGIVVLLYVLLLFCCYHGDLHDNRKGGIVYLLDNTPLDQQKYEITMETGFWRNAGTTSKISIILHGEEGMSETRELISEDDRPMFERNSRDKFILTLPDSIGRIWKVQVWHNNFGPSPSWYLSRVIVRDLITGVQYMFLCEKWLAVEEQDGKAYMTKAVEYMADFHIWLSILTCPPNSGFMRCERLTVCLTMILAYMCLNAMWYRTAVTEPKHASCSQSSPDTVAEWEPEFPSGKPNEADSVDSSEQIQPIMTYSLLDQSILNWPNIQTWAQKQWRKRQQTHTRGNQEFVILVFQPFLSDLGNSGGGSEVLGHSNHCNLGLSPPHHDIPGVNPMDLAALQRYGLSEMDQASSGFEDCSSLIRPKASMDSTHTTAAPSVNESTRVHKPQSISDSLAVSTKLPSEAGTVKTSKAPSISSTASNKS
ncbi:PK1L1-like protein, partial [Mya arenaria]